MLQSRRLQQYIVIYGIITLFIDETMDRTHGWNRAVDHCGDQRRRAKRTLCAQLNPTHEFRVPELPKIAISVDLCE
jgi:hypothetical protein